MSNAYNFFSKTPTNSSDRLEKKKNELFFSNAYKQQASGNLSKNKDVSTSSTNVPYYIFKDNSSHLKFTKGLYEYAKCDSSNCFLEENKMMDGVNDSQYTIEDLSGTKIFIKETTNTTTNTNQFLTLSNDASGNLVLDVSNNTTSNTTADSTYIDDISNNIIGLDCNLKPFINKYVEMNNPKDLNEKYNYPFPINTNINFN